MQDLKTIVCKHPQRPDAPAPVGRWYFGCPQHEPLENPPMNDLSIKFNNGTWKLFNTRTFRDVAAFDTFKAAEAAFLKGAR